MLLSVLQTPLFCIQTEIFSLFVAWRFPAKPSLLAALLLGVALPLTILLAVQYEFLVQLRVLKDQAEQREMSGYLAAVQHEMLFFYRAKSAELLTLPDAHAGDIRHAAAEHFKSNPWKGTCALFLLDIPEGSDLDVQFYVRDSGSFHRAPGSSLEQAVVRAWKEGQHVLAMPNMFEANSFVIGDEDPQFRCVFKPMRNETGRVFRAAGMVLDLDFLRREYLPAAIQKALPPRVLEDTSFFVTGFGSADELVGGSSTQTGFTQQMTVPLQIFFKGLQLTVRARDRSGDSWARWHLLINITLSIVMTTVLLASIGISLRSAFQAMRLSQIKADFVSNVSHELRTPLASLQIFGEILRLGHVTEPKRVREYGGYIEGESRRLTQLVSNILDFSQIESGARQYQRCDSDVTDVVRTVLEDCSEQLLRNSFKWRLDVPPGPLPHVKIDSQAIELALRNLLDNAVKYSTEVREIELAIRSENGFIAVAVADHGIGIARSEQERIFEKFYRVSTGFVHDVKGSGLGLSIVKHILEGHGGAVRVDSKPGRGSTFTLLLPLTDEDPSRSAGTVVP